MPSIRNYTSLDGTLPSSDSSSDDNSANQDASAVNMFSAANMSSLMYAVAGTIIVVCLIIHGCLFYRRWRQKRRRPASTTDKETGLSPLKALAGGTSTETPRKNCVISITESDRDQQSTPDSIKKKPLEPKSSHVHSLLDQELNERRRRSSSVRVKVFPPRELSTSFSGPSQSFQRPSEDGQSESSSGDKNTSSKAALAAELTELISNSSPKFFDVGRSDAVNSDLEVCKFPSGEGSSHYELIECSSGPCVSVSQTNGYSLTSSGSKRRVPAQLEAKASEEAYDCLDLDNLSVTWRDKSSSKPDRLKRRSYSFDQSPVFDSSFHVTSHNHQKQTLATGRSRSASESRKPSITSQKTPPKISVEFLNSASGTSKTDPTYLTLEPNSEAELKQDRRYRTLPPINYATSSQYPRSFKRKFSINTLFSRKSKRSEKKLKDKQKTPPCSPGRNTSHPVQSAIYDEPQEPNPAVVQHYFTLEPNDERDVIDYCDENIRSNEPENTSKSKSSFLRTFPGSRNKNKSTPAISTQSSTKSEEFQDANGAYEVLQIPSDDPKKTVGPVYDILEPDLPSVPTTSKNFPVIGKTTTGTPLRKYRAGSARRELPSTPHDYDIIERGLFPSTGAISRSESTQLNIRRGSSPATQRPTPKSSTTYDSLSPLVPDRLKYTDSTPRRGSTPETARRKTNQYDLLNPETFLRQSSTGSVEDRRSRPQVSPKPQSLRLPRTSNVVYDLLNPGLLVRRGSMGAGPGPRPTPRPLLRTNSMGKLRKINPEVSPKPPRDRKLKSSKVPNSKPAVPSRKPNVNGAKNTDPVYFTLDPNTIAEPV